MMIIEFNDAICEYKRLHRDEPQKMLMRINPNYYATMHPKERTDGRCPKCGDAGFVRMNFPIGHPYFGKPIRCPRCGG